MENILLTAKQIAHFDEIKRDKAAVKATLDAAMAYHSNRHNELHKEHQDLWEEILTIHGLDVTKSYTTKKANGAMIVMEVPDENNSD